MKLLSVGHDHTVLESRTQLLQQDGFEVLATMDVHEAVRVFASTSFAAVLIGDSIPLFGREFLMEELRRVNSEIPIICVCRGTCLHPADFRIVCVDKFNPAELLRVVRNVIHGLGVRDEVSNR